MDEKLIEKLLRERKEQDWFDFKRKLKLYESDGKLAEKTRDELIKDIVGLANGNSHIVRKTKYLIVGVDDLVFDEKGCRKLHNVNYKVPPHDDLVKWLSAACSPVIVGLESDLLPYGEINLFVITIPPTFDLHVITRELNGSSHFNKHTVFMRQGENTVTASPQDGVTIQQLKHLHRQEIANPSPIWIGAVAGAVSAFIIGGANIKVAQTDLSIPESLIQIILTGLGAFFGASIGYYARQGNEIRYAWRYMTWRQRMISLVVVSILLIIFLLIFR